MRIHRRSPKGYAEIYLMRVFAAHSKTISSVNIARKELLNILALAFSVGVTECGLGRRIGLV